MGASIFREMKLLSSFEASSRRLLTSCQIKTDLHPKLSRRTANGFINESLSPCTGEQPFDLAATITKAWEPCRIGRLQPECWRNAGAVSNSDGGAFGAKWCVGQKHRIHDPHIQLSMDSTDGHPRIRNGPLKDRALPTRPFLTTNTATPRKSSCSFRRF